MKLTLNIDDDLLSRVMESTGAKTKTEAIHAALAEVDRRHKLITLLSEDIGFNWDTDIDTTAWDRDDAATARIAETPSVTRDRKSRPRR
jgi:Arc/MetJ family transcription regulator